MKLLDQQTKMQVGGQVVVENLWLTQVCIIPWENLQTPPTTYLRMSKSALCHEKSYVSSCLSRTLFNDNFQTPHPLSPISLHQLEAPKLWKYGIWVPNMWLTNTSFLKAINAWILAIYSPFTYGSNKCLQTNQLQGIYIHALAVFGPPHNSLKFILFAQRPYSVFKNLTSKVKEIQNSYLVEDSLLACSYFRKREIVNVKENGNSVE